jgi:hypothetical protein
MSPRAPDRSSRNAGPIPLDLVRPVRFEHEYERNGTPNLLRCLPFPPAEARTAGQRCGLWLRHSPHHVFGATLSPPKVCHEVR